MDIIKVFGENVRKYRIAMGLSQEDFAEKCGLHRTYISAIERFQRNISIENVQKIADALEMESYRLLTILEPHFVGSSHLVRGCLTLKIAEGMKYGSLFLCQRLLKLYSELVSLIRNGISLACTQSAVINLINHRSTSFQFALSLLFYSIIGSVLMISTHSLYGVSILCSPIERNDNDDQT